jgi:hypothetical protein
VIIRSACSVHSSSDMLLLYFTGRLQTVLPSQFPSFLRPISFSYRVSRIRNRRELNTSLKGTTLGDPEGDEDTLKWIKKAKKREKELAKKREQELDNLDQAFQDEYTERSSYNIRPTSLSNSILAILQVILLASK